MQFQTLHHEDAVSNNYSLVVNRLRKSAVIIYAFNAILIGFPCYQMLRVNMQ